MREDTEGPSVAENDELKSGDKILLFPVPVSGVVMGSGPDTNAPEDGERLYEVKFPEQTLLVPRKNLIAAPSTPETALAEGPEARGEEWHKGYGRLLELTEKFLADKDQTVVVEIFQLASQLGLLGI